MFLSLWCRGVQGVWLQLQDIHNAFGLRYQWGGSHSNKVLLCSLGIDTRNIVSGFHTLHNTSTRNHVELTDWESQ